MAFHTHDWIDDIRVGDVLEMPSGTYRVVRDVSKHPPKWAGSRGNVFVYFSIKRCSWTTRCYTIYSAGALVDWRPTGHRVKLGSKLDKQIEAEFRRPGGADRCVLHCCDVEHAL